MASSCRRAMLMPGIGGGAGPFSGNGVTEPVLHHNELGALRPRKAEAILRQRRESSPLRSQAMSPDSRIANRL
jgi:hypothetical protein